MEKNTQKIEIKDIIKLIDKALNHLDKIEKHLALEKEKNDCNNTSGSQRVEVN